MCSQLFKIRRQLLQKRGFFCVSHKSLHYTLHVIITLDILLKTTKTFFCRRYMANRTLFDELVSKARSFSSSYSTIGGNAAVMGMRFAREGCDVTLAAKLTKSLHQMIPQMINVVGGEVKRDDIHLILEYKHGEVWGPYSSARANRYVLMDEIYTIE